MAKKHFIFEVIAYLFFIEKVYVSLESDLVRLLFISPPWPPPIFSAYSLHQRSRICYVQW